MKNINVNTEKILNKTNIEKNQKTNINRNKVNTTLILNSKNEFSEKN